jgi:hypothetical protein
MSMRAVRSSSSFVQWAAAAAKSESTCSLCALKPCSWQQLIVPPFARSIEIDLPIEEEFGSGLDKPPAELVDVTVPADALPGSEFLVELADGAQFFVQAPEGAIPGVTTITIEVPPPIFEGADENQPPPSNHATGSGADRHTPSRSHPSAPLGGRHRRSISRDVSDVLNTEWKRLGRYFEWQVLEVERSDGNSSRCTVEDYDEYGDTYTVRLLNDGRVKHFVEDIALRATRCGSFAAGTPVSWAAPAGRRSGRVDAFDDESGTYTVRLADGRCQYYMEEEELTNALPLDMRGA